VLIVFKALLLIMTVFSEPFLIPRLLPSEEIVKAESLISIITFPNSSVTFIFAVDVALTYSTQSNPLYNKT
jgi:hypothetical protein